MKKLGRRRRPVVPKATPLGLRRFCNKQRSSAYVLSMFCQPADVMLKTMVRIVTLNDGIDRKFNIQSFMMIKIIVFNNNGQMTIITITITTVIIAIYC